MTKNHLLIIFAVFVTFRGLGVITRPLESWQAGEFCNVKKKKKIKKTGWQCPGDGFGPVGAWAHKPNIDLAKFGNLEFFGVQESVPSLERNKSEVLPAPPPEFEKRLSSPECDKFPGLGVEPG